MAQPAPASQSPAGWMIPVRAPARAPSDPIAASTGPGDRASRRPDRLHTRATSRVTAAMALALAIGSENQMAEARPRPRLMPAAAAGLRAAQPARAPTSGA